LVGYISLSPRVGARTYMYVVLYPGYTQCYHILSAYTLYPIPYLYHMPNPLTQPSVSNPIPYTLVFPAAFSRRESVFVSVTAYTLYALTRLLQLVQRPIAALNAISTVVSLSVLAVRTEFSSHIAIELRLLASSNARLLSHRNSASV
jgi:hypothetical protein